MLDYAKIQRATVERLRAYVDGTSAAATEAAVRERLRALGHGHSAICTAAFGRAPADCFGMWNRQTYRVADRP